MPAEPAVVVRLLRTVEYVSGMIPNNSVMSGVVKRVVDDMVEQIMDFPPELVELYTKQISGLLYWVAEGQELDGVDLPPDFTKE